MKDEEDVEAYEKTMTAMARTMTVGDDRPFASLYPMASQPEWQVVDGELVLQGEATDGWMRSSEKAALKLKRGKHLVRIKLKRTMPGGWIQMDISKDGELLAMESVNPLKGL